MPFNTCPFCPTNDTYIEPLKIDLPIVKIRSGRYTDCQDLCVVLYYSDCKYFNFYTSEHEGELKNYCVLFLDKLDPTWIDGHKWELKKPMKGVISGMGLEELIYFQDSSENEKICEKLGRDCWSGCNETQGQCDWCGEGIGYCCMKSEKSADNGCDGSFGGNNYYACSLHPGNFNGPGSKIF